MAANQLKPNDRYAFVGKTRSGKTAEAMVLAGTFARSLPYPWECWWIDTKGDPNDLKALRAWGFRNAASPEDRSPESGGLRNALYFKIESSSDEVDMYDEEVVDIAQAIFKKAYQKKKVIVVIDEYVQVVYSKQSAGKALLNIFQRGGGRNVGLIGLTQEPVFVPRQLISQATHIAIFSLTFENDKKYMRNICPVYVSPLEIGDPHGFYWSWIDGHAEWQYYKDQAKWYDTVNIARPREVEIGKEKESLPADSQKI